MTKPLLLPVFIFGWLAFWSGNCRAEDASRATAYTALRSMGKSLGPDSLNRVVEVTGRGGTPQPAVWRIVIRDGSNGSREIKVEGAKIISQRTSSQGSSLRPIRLQDLNLDSSGAFDAANEQARKTRVPFTSLDYTLRVNEATSKPVWDLELHNEAGTRVGGVRLAAHDGKLVSTSGFNPASPTPTPRTLVSADPDHDSVRPSRVNPARSTTTTTTTTYHTVRPVPPPPDERPDGSALAPGEGGFFSRAGRTLDHTTEVVGDSVSRTGRAVDQTMRHTGEKLQRFFTGHGDSGTGNTQPD